MGILNNLIAGKYQIRVNCGNCHKDVTLNVIRGVSERDWLASGRARCPVCGCVIQVEKEYKD